MRGAECFRRLLVAGLLAGCSTASDPAKLLRLAEPSCAPFEVIVLRHRVFNASSPQGIVVAFGPTTEPVDGVRVTLRRLGERQVAANLATDRGGGFSFNSLGEGWYQVETCKEGYDSVVAIAHIYSKAIHPALQIEIQPAN